MWHYTASALVAYRMHRIVIAECLFLYNNSIENSCAHSHWQRLPRWHSKWRQLTFKAFPTSHFKQKTYNYITIAHLRLLTGYTDVPNTIHTEITSHLSTDLAFWEPKRTPEHQVCVHEMHAVDLQKGESDMFKVNLLLCVSKLIDSVLSFDVKIAWFIWQSYQGA